MRNNSKSACFCSFVRGSKCEDDAEPHIEAVIDARKDIAMTKHFCTLIGTKSDRWQRNDIFKEMCEDRYMLSICGYHVRFPSMKIARHFGIT